VNERVQRDAIEDVIAFCLIPPRAGFFVLESMEKQLKIAIQGGDGSFHDIAARNYFPHLKQTLKCVTFKDVCEEVKRGEADFGVIAFENTIAGTILGNYSLIQNYHFNIIGEIRLRIVMNLMAIPGQKISDIHVVRSHYMALLQCSDFLSQYPHIHLEEYYDTADAAKDIFKRKEKGAAAIAGHLAAELYGLEILQPSIETFKENYTKFFVVSKDRSLKVKNATKATISLRLPDDPGSLYKLLGIIYKYEINITKIQSIPVLGRQDTYTFYLELDWEDWDAHNHVLEEMRDYCFDMHILGQYKKGETYQ
jgi:prephenate dehydratase